MTIFISAASEEFGPERIKLRQALEAEGHRVLVQETFDTHGRTGLLRKLSKAIQDADLVIALIGKTGGGAEPSEKQASAFSAIRTGQGFDQASYTQWEVFFALEYEKSIGAIGPREVFQRSERFADATQALLTERIRDDGFIWFELGSKDEIVAAALRKVKDEMNGKAARPAPRYPTITQHAQNLHNLSINLLLQSAEAAIEEQEIGDWFASRPAAFLDQPYRKPLELPAAVYRNAEVHRRNEAEMRQYLFVGGPGSGKTTLMYQLLNYFSQAERIERLKMVPLVANCLTLVHVVKEDAPPKEVLRKWLEIAIAPTVHSAESDDAARLEHKVSKFVQEVKDGGLTLLILVDGLDELDPSGMRRGERAAHLFDAFNAWLEDSGIHSHVFLATTRPDLDTQTEAELRGLAVLELRPPGRHELDRIARHLLSTDRGEPSQQILNRFLDEFTSGNEVNSALVYLQPLARYYREFPGEALRHPTTRTKLMEIERESIVRRIRNDLDPRRRELDAAIRHVLIEIAVRSLHEYDLEIPASLSRISLSEMGSVQAVPGLPELVKRLSERLVHRLLHVLIYDHRRGNKEGSQFYYRLPHNEYRDYILADGIFQWIQGTGGAPWDLEVRRELASAYLGAERVKDFLREIVQDKLGDPGSEGRRRFTQSLVSLMNDPEQLSTHEPRERTKASPHGAMLSLLLTLGPLPNLKVIGRSVSFQGTTIWAQGGRLRIPLASDCSGAVFRESHLRGANLSGLRLDRADFDNAELGGATLEGASLRGADLRNVGMGRFGEFPTALSGADLDGADLFNYRFQLAGFYHFWDLEVAGDEKNPERYVLAAGSRGQILAFDLSRDDELYPVTIQTVPRPEGANEILDLSTHPLHRDVVVVTGRDSSVRILKLFSGPPSAWPGKRDAQGFEVVELPEVGRKDDLFHQGTYRPYSRRALFSPSGSWLAVTARDKRIAFLKVSPHGERFDLDGTTFGREHMGPVMCVVADREPVTGLEEGDRARDRFFTAGYDGRVALWREEQSGSEQSWKRAKAASKVTMAGKRKGVDIIRSLVPEASGRLWAGTERGQWLRLYEFPAEESEQPVLEKKVRHFPGGVFALAVYEDLLAVGLSNGKVQVFRASESQGSYNRDRPGLDIDTSDAIVRSLQFIRGGKQLLVATWDGCLFRFALDRKEPLAVFRYPREQWQPEWDGSQIQFDGDPFQKAKRISTRMREYLLLVQQARPRV